MINDIYEVQTFGSGVWVGKDVYEEVKETLQKLAGMSRDEILGKSIEFNSLSGQVHVLMLTGIAGITHSTKEQRKTQMSIYAQYQEEQMGAQFIMGNRDAQTS